MFIFLFLVLRRLKTNRLVRNVAHDAQSFAVASQSTTRSWIRAKHCLWQLNLKARSILKARSGVNFTNVFMCSFYAAKIPKAQKASWPECLFALLESLSIKAARKMLVKLTPGISNRFLGDAFSPSYDKCGPCRLQLATDQEPILSNFIYMLMQYFCDFLF